MRRHSAESWKRLTTGALGIAVCAGGVAKSTWAVEVESLRPGARFNGLSKRDHIAPKDTLCDPYLILTAIHDGRVAQVLTKVVDGLIERRSRPSLAQLGPKHGQQRITTTESVR